MGPSSEIRTLIKILTNLFHHPIRTASNKKEALKLIKTLFSGYAAATDAPASGLVPELLELYPNATVICTIRDLKSWGKSMEGVTSVSTLWFLKFVLLLVPGMRHFPDYINKLREQWMTLYGDVGHEPHTVETYERHIKWLKNVVPEDKLVFFNVKEGWEPLCKAFKKPVPQGLKFSKINDGEAIEKLAKIKITQGLVRWLLIFATISAALVPMMWLRN